MFDRKYKKLKEGLDRLDYSLYLQIEQYANRADTKYHRGRIDGLISARGAIEKIIKESEKNDNRFFFRKRDKR